MDIFSKTIIKLINVFILTASLVLVSKSFAAPIPVLPDPALNTCLTEHVSAHSWTTAEEVTILNCVDRDVETLVGIEALVNLLELIVSGNKISILFLPFLQYH